MTDYDPWADFRHEKATPPPVQKLIDLGLANETPKWWRDERTEATGHGLAYIVTPRFLSPTDLRHLAALTLEGFHVQVYPRNSANLMRVTIKEDVA